MKRMVIVLFILFCFPVSVSGKLHVPILIYHSIDKYTGIGSKELFVTPENFEKQMTYLKKNGYTLLTFEQWQDIDKVKKPIFITLDDGYKNNWHVFEIFTRLADNQFQPRATLFVISDFVGSPNRLTGEELNRLAKSGYFSVQSHTATHPDLTKEKNIEYELKGSKEKIEKMTGKPVIALAYPYGNFNEQVVRETKKYYLFGITTTPGPYQEMGYQNELYVLPRIYVKYSTSLEDFIRTIEQ
ncbi:polysaccharide deacetylase family protein [Pseudoneobacillus sp. C159]